MEKELIDLYLHEYSDNLARQLHIKTGLPIYGIYDVNERIYTWGVNYYQFFIKVDDTYYLNAKGLSTETELKAYWSDIYNDPDLLYSLRIIKKSPELISTGYKDLDDEIERLGSGRTIHPHIKLYADILIDTFGLLLQ